MLEAGSRLSPAAEYSAGASHLSVNTMKAGFANVDEHLTALEQVATDLT